MPFKIETIQQIAEQVQKSSPDVVAVTGKMGISYDDSKKFYPMAKVAAEKNQPTRAKLFKGYWIPFRIGGDNALVFGLKGDLFPEKQARLINGLILAEQHNLFLGEHLKKMNYARNKFIRELLTGDVCDYSFEEAKKKGDILGVNLRMPEAVMLFDIPGWESRIEREALKLEPGERQEHREKRKNSLVSKISEGFGYNEQNNIAFLERDKIVVLKWASGNINTRNSINFFRTRGEYIRNIINEYTKLPTTAGVGQYYPGLGGLRKSYNSARAVLDLGERIMGPGRTYHVTDLGMFIVFSQLISERRKAEFAHQLLGSILEDKDYLKTVKVFLESNMNLTDAAKKLHVHRNTLIYRLDKTKSACGLDPRKFSDAVQIKLGLLLYSPAETVTPKTDSLQKVELVNSSC